MEPELPKVKKKRLRVQKNPSEPRADLKTRFQPGNKLGKGRKEGSKTHSQLAIEKIGVDAAVECYERIVDMAREGDWRALQFIVSRTVPEPKRSYVEIEIPLTDSLKNINIATMTVVEQVSNGNISLEQATSLMTLLSSRRESQENVEIIAKMEVLEQDIVARGHIEMIADGLKNRQNYTDEQVKVLFDSVKHVIDNHKKKAKSTSS